MNKREQNISDRAAEYETMEWWVLFFNQTKVHTYWITHPHIPRNGIMLCVLGRWVSIKFNFIMLYICFENIIINMLRSWLLADRVHAPQPLNHTSTTALEYFTSTAPTTKTLWYCLVFSCLDALLPGTMMIAQRNWLTEADTISFNNIIVFN